MNVQRETLRLVQSTLKGTWLCKDVLVVLPTEHLLRGFVFERTTEKEIYYLWRVIMPLYRPVNSVILNYSKRISINGGKIRITRQGLKQDSERIAALIGSGHLRYLRRVKGPKEFLDHVSWMIGNTTMTFNLDLALTYYMLGNVDQCIKIFKDLPRERLPPAVRANMVSFFTEVTTSPVDAASRVQAWERGNVERLGLAETVIGVGQNSVR
jgi:hypothetical protein